MSGGMDGSVDVLIGRAGTWMGRHMDGRVDEWMDNTFDCNSKTHQQTGKATFQYGTRLIIRRTPIIWLSNFPSGHVPGSFTFNMAESKQKHVLLTLAQKQEIRRTIDTGEECGMMAGAFGISKQQVSYTCIAFIGVYVQYCSMALPGLGIPDLRERSANLWHCR